MEYRSGKSSKLPGSNIPVNRFSVGHQQGQRHGSGTDRQHGSLERYHGHRTGNSTERRQSSSSLERQHRSRLDTSVELSQAGRHSLERLHRHRTSDQQYVTASSLERLHRLRTGNSAELQQLSSLGLWQQGSGSSLEGLHGSRIGNTGADRQQIVGVRPACPIVGAEQRQSPKHGKESTKKQKQSLTEKKVEELSRQLEEEKATSRRTITKLQRDLARLKSERAHNQRDGREGVMKEVERERMLRVDTEQRLQEMREESDSCRARLHALQDEFRKMEDMVRDMLQYKTKIDQLKQEKANLATTYETNVQKCRNHISTLERENMMLLNQVKKMESQIHGKGDDRDKSRLLLERLKMVEGENSSLVLENEQQRQQYEKCLDQIANQVVQALLAQKTLREECLKLQNRVHDLELQNRQLNRMFQQRVRFPSDPSMQQLSSAGGATYVWHAEGGQGEASNAQFLQGSAVSLHSMFSETMFDDSPGYPQMSTPPPWLRDRLELPLEDEISLSSSSTSGSPSSPGQPTNPCSAVAVGGKSRPSPSASSAALAVPGLTTKIETEFPATNSSPKMKHVNVMERGTRSLERRGDGKGAGFHPLIYSVGPTKANTGSEKKGKSRSSSDTLAMNQLSEQAWQKLEAQVRSQKSSVRQAMSSVKQSTSAEIIVSAPSPQSASPRHSASEAVGEKAAEGVVGKGKGKGKSDSKDRVKSSPGKAGVNGAGKSQLSPLFSKVKLRRKGSNSSRDSSRSPHRSVVRNSMPPSMPHHSQYYYDYSDEDSDSRPVSRVYSCASTVSLNELLDTSADGDLTLDDDFFSDWSSMCLSPQHRLHIHPTNQHLHPFPPGQQPSGGGQGQSSHTSPQTSSGGSHLYHKLLSQGVGPRSRAGGDQRAGAGVKTEREDSGCEVEPSHTDRRESWQCNKSVGVESANSGTRPSAVMTVPTGAMVQVNTDIVPASHTASGPSPSQGQSSEHSPSPDPCAKLDPAAVVCTVSLPSKTVTQVHLPSPQAAVLIQQPAWSRSDSEQSPTSESSCAVSPDKPPDAALVVTSPSLISPLSPTDPETDSCLPSNNGPKTSTTDTDPSSGSKLKSKPLTAEEKSRVCRPDQLILAPADKTVHGFTSSSSCSSEDKSPFPQGQPPERPFRQCSRTSGVSEASQASSKPKNSPPTVPHKPSKSQPGANTVTSLDQTDLSTKSASAVNNGGSSNSSVSGASGDSGVSSKKSGGSVGKGFPVDTTLTVGFMSVEPQHLDQVAHHPDTVRDFVNSLVRDMKERVARHSDWPITSTATASGTNSGALAYCKSLDSSFESLRAERSGSKDDGYSTMSSDIHPVAMDKYSYVDIVVAKPNTDISTCLRKTSDPVHDLIQAGSPKKRNKSTETSETDSAMETSAHSMDTRNSSHSLSSQVSSSSGENILSPVAKANRMARFFEDESSKSSGSSTTTTTHPYSVGTPSPLSPTGVCSLVSEDSSLCLSPKSSITSPESDGSFKQMYASVVSKPLPVPVSDCGQSQPEDVIGASASSASSTICAPNSSASSPVSGSVGQRIHDMVQTFQAGLKDKVSPTASQHGDQTPPSPKDPQSVGEASQSSEMTSPLSPSHRPSELRCSPERSRPLVRTTICDFKKYEINDPSKLNLSHSPPPDLATRRENVVSWPPPRKITPPLSPSPLSPVAYTQCWEPVTSPLHVIEEKPLDDIPEESGDEWDNGCVRTTQEQQQQNQNKRGEGKSKSSSSSGGSSPRASRRSMKKCKSESNLSEKPRTMSLYDEMMSGSWDSGKVLERSASLSEVDFRSTQTCLEEQGYLHGSFLHLSFDEADIQEKVAALLGRSKWAETSDSEAEAQKQLNDLWNTLMAQRPADIPPWTPKETAEALKQKCTPSPTSIQKLNNANPEDWILGFSKEEIEKHTSAKSFLTHFHPHTNSGSDPHNTHVASMDLPQFGLKGEAGKLLCFHQSDHEKDGDEDSNDEGPRPVSIAQKLFHSEFYSLCPAMSTRSLASSNCSVYRSRDHLNEDIAPGTSPNSFQSRLPHPSYITEGIHAREFDEISHQIASLSRTVDELNRSLNSLNSESHMGSKLDLHDSDDSESGKGKEASGGGAWSSSRQECIEGYHWVEDEFYLTSCGGEIIIGSAALLEEEEGMEDYCDGGGGEAGGMFALEDNDDAIADDAQDDFYCIRLPPRRPSRVNGPPPVRPVSGGSDSEHILNNLVQFRYNSDGQLSRQPTSSNGRAGTGQQGIGWSMDSSCSHSSLSHALRASTTIITTTTAVDRRARQGLFEDVGGDGGSERNLLADREHRANLLDSMLPSGAESNDSLSSDIGLDHMICQRLMGRKGKREVVRFSAPRQRPALDLSHFYMHYNKMEQDAVAAFDFLEDISTSESTEHLDMFPDSASRRCRSSSQPLSREVVMRQTQVRQHREVDCVVRNPRPLSESDFRKFRLPAGHAVGSSQGWHDQQHPPHYSPNLPHRDQANRRRNLDVNERQGDGPSGTTPPRRQKLRRRRKKSEVKDKSHSKDSNPSQPTEVGGGGKGSTPHRSGRGSRGRKGGERLRREWHDIKVGDTVANTLSLSDSCCDTSSSPSPPSLSYTDLSKF